MKKLFIMKEFKEETEDLISREEDFLITSLFV